MKSYIIQYCMSPTVLLYLERVGTRGGPDHKDIHFLTGGPHGHGPCCKDARNGWIHCDLRLTDRLNVGPQSRVYCVHRHTLLVMHISYAYPPGYAFSYLSALYTYEYSTSCNHGTSCTWSLQRLNAWSRTCSVNNCSIPSMYGRGAGAPASGMGLPGNLMRRS